MIDLISNWLAAIIGWADAIPLTFWAIIAGVMTGGLLTQWLKRTLPVSVMFPNMPKEYQVLWLRVSALVFSFLPTYFIWPKDHAYWVALVVGLGTPTAYRVISFFLYKRWPELESKFSGTEGV